MPYNANLGPDRCYGIDDSGFCSVCEEHLDTGACTCQRCDECDTNIEEQDQFETEVPRATDGVMVKVMLCVGCFEKREAVKS